MSRDDLTTRNPMATWWDHGKKEGLDQDTLMIHCSPRTNDWRPYRFMIVSKEGGGKSEQKRHHHDAAG